MIRITIDESMASAEESAALRVMDGYAELKLAVEKRGSREGIILISIGNPSETGKLPGDLGIDPELMDVAKHDMQDGTWVARKDDRDRPTIGKVRDAYTSGNELLLDIVIFEKGGKKVGRESPAAGGPKGFEPACSAENWEPIAKPDFEFLGDKFFWGRHLKRLRGEEQPRSCSSSGEEQA